MQRGECRAAYSGAIKKGLTDIPTMSLVVNQSDMWNGDGNGGFYRQEDVEKLNSTRRTAKLWP